jgi:hyperosmotically inducible protein
MNTLSSRTSHVQIALTARAARAARAARTKFRAISAVAALALALLLTSGAALAQSQQQNRDNRSADYITKEVRHQLVMIPYYSLFDNLEYRVDGSTVTLMGQVVHATIKDDAEAAVKHVEGVDKVVNNIEILPPSPNDDQIRFAEARAIYSFPSLQKYGFQAVQAIHIIVKGGHVTLEGVVDNQADKDAANVRANGVAGVFSVTNNLHVGNTSK